MNLPPKYRSRQLKQFLSTLIVFLMLCVNVMSAGTPQVILRSVLVNTVEKRYDSSLVCSHDENNFQFVYEGVDLTFSGQIFYRYRLHSNAVWNETQERTLNFPALAPGSYRFEVEAKNDSNQWSAPTSFSFKVEAPLYEQWWFIAIEAALIVSVAVWIVVLRNRHYLKKAREELQVQLRLNEMENQAKSAMMNPHFVFNALNSIQQYINDNDRVAANKYLTKFSRLIRLNLDLVNRNLISLEEELEKLKLYLEIEQLRFGEKLQYEFQIDQQLETDLLFIPSMILQPFIENSIWHGLMSSGKGGKITLNLASFNNEKMLRIEIMDDGIGINQSKQLNQQRNRKSFGMTLTVDRLKLFGKKYGEDARVSITDLSEENISLHGTRVVLELPAVFEKNSSLLKSNF